MRIKIAFLLLLYSGPVFCQTYNTVKTWTAKKPISHEADLTSTARTVQEVQLHTVFADGFGRTVQSVTKRVSPLQMDLVRMHVYDTWGREVQQNLPFVSGNNGDIKSSAQSLQQTFYQGLYPGESSFFTKVDFENSPMNRSLKTYSPGSSWAGGNRGTTVQYLVNTATDNVRIWNIAAAQGSLPTSSGSYAANQLYKSLVIDEKGVQSISYKDKNDHVILEKTQLTAAADNGNGSAHSGWLCTYYVYDDYDNLRFIITPKVVGTIDGTWTISQSLADELCFRLEYDNFNRVIIQKSPGTPTGAAGEEWAVYDQRGRKVLIQDGNLRSQQKWQYYQYDVQDRQIGTGLLNDPTNYNNRTFHQNNAINQTSYPNLASYTTEVLSQVYYDNYNWVAGSGSGVGSSLDASNNNNTSIFYTASNTTAPYPQPIQQSPYTRGLVTGSKTEVLETNGTQYLYTVSFYDDNGRIIQTQGNNLTNGIDKVTTQYSWAGHALRVYEQHSKLGAGAQTHKVLTKFTYDHDNRLMSVTKNISSTVNGSTVNSGDKLISNYTYYETGQVKSKTLGTLETLNYDYNIRGWVTGINKNYTMAGNTGNWFGQELGYDKTATAAGTTSFLTARYDGNISGQVWRSRGDGVPRKYDYSYDNASQLTAAGYLQNTSASAWDKSYIDFSLNNVTYDLNGNIKTLNQNGFVLGGTPAVDNLTYNYLNSGNSNRLQNVIDNANNANSKLGDFHYSGTKTASSVDYSFDNNGNRISDVNKGISSISYNVFNLPKVITFAGGSTLTFQYDASGNKLKKTMQEVGAVVHHNGANYTSNITTTTSYIGGFIFQSKTYSNASLSSLNRAEALVSGSHEEGRIRLALLPSGATGWVFDYFVRDNLGNIRMTLTDEAQTDVYPAATLEAGGIAGEQTYYNIVNDASHVVATSSLPWWSSVTGNSYNNSSNGIPVPPDPTTSPGSASAKLYKLNGATGDRFGMGIALKVMAGDVVNVFGKSVWHNNGQATNNTSYQVAGVLTSFINAFAGTNAVVSGSKGIANGTILNGNTNTTGPLTTLLNNAGTPSGQTPKAYINWILFDEQFKPVAGGNGADLINAAADVVKSHTIPAINISKNGYLYVYCSNESNQDVYFDNLQVRHTRGPLMAEQHYYPYGLSMFGLTSKAFGKLQVNFGFQGKELQSNEFYDGRGLEEYDFEARYYDPQLARWWSPDAVDNFSTPYAAMYNNPNSYVDVDGRNPLVIAAIVGAALGAYSGYKIAEAKGYNLGDLKTWGYMLGGAAIGAFSGYAGASVAAGGGFMANTMGIMYGSAFNSIGMSVLSGGMVSPMVSFGVASINLGTGEWGYLGKKGNTFMENLGYTFGALANLQDVVTGFWGDSYQYQYETEKGSSVGHGNVRHVTTDATGAVTTEVKISVANKNPVYTKHDGILGAIEYAWKANFRKHTGGPEHWLAVPEAGWPRIPLTLNSKIIDWMYNNLTNDKGLWGITRTRFGLNYGCVSYAARALWTAGVPTIPIINYLGPRVLWLQLAIRQVGIDASGYLINIPE